MHLAEGSEAFRSPEAGARDCMLLLESPSMPVRPGPRALMETMGCSCSHHESGSWLRPCSLALLLYTTSAQAPSRPVADHDFHLQLGWAAVPPESLASSRDRSVLQTSPRAEVALPTSLSLRGLS